MSGKKRTAREAAAFALFDMAENGAWSDGALHKQLDQAGLSGRDSALATQLVYGTVQNELLCDWYLRRFSKVRLAKLSPRVHICLRMAVYQLVFLDRVPAYAAVDETVSIIRKYARVGEKAVAFSNAVLHAVADAAAQDALPRLNCPDKESYYSLRYSHPEWLVRRLSSQYGQKETERILIENNKLTPVSVRVNQIRMTREQVCEALCASGFSAAPHPTAESVLLVSGGDVASHALFRDGAITVQDAAGTLAVDLLDPKPGEFVIDCCAAPGGKSFAIAERMNNTGRLFSCDIFAHKLKRIEEGSERLHLTNLTAFLQDAAQNRAEWNDMADRVLCDVPCSGMGIIRKKPEIRYKTEEEIAELPAIQSAILANCARYVKPGGTLVYSTCTILREENEAVVKAFLAQHPEFESVPFTHPICGEMSEGWVTLLPHLHQTDGFFIAKLRRKE